METTINTIPRSRRMVASGDIYCQYTYDSWGKLVSIKDASGNDKTNDLSFYGTKNPFRYRGYYYDTETGMYYLQSRYYMPEWGRFLNADGYFSTGTSPDSKNMFAYCLNNPVNMADPDGHKAIYITESEFKSYYSQYYSPSTNTFSFTHYDDYYIPYTYNGLTYYKEVKANAKPPSKVSSAGQKSIKYYDSLNQTGAPHLKAYYDREGVKTNGWGYTGQRNPLLVKDNITFQEAEINFQSDLAIMVNHANSMCVKWDIHLTQQQFDAAIMFGFQNGPFNGDMTALMKLMATGSSTAVKDYLMGFAGGGGLLSRRMDEYNIYAYGRYIGN